MTHHHAVADIELTEDHVLLEHIEQPMRQHHGLAINPKSLNSHEHAHVVAVGPGLTRKSSACVPCELTPGQRVVYDAQLAQPVTINDVKYLMTQESTGIIAVLES